MFQGGVVVLERRLLPGSSFLNNRGCSKTRLARQRSGLNYFEKNFWKAKRPAGPRL
jgi:hypothetical protein